MTRAGEILRQAADAVDGPRNSQHGDKERSFACIAEGWAWYVGHLKGPIEPKHVAAMQIILKLGRELYGLPIPDHYMDICGYGGIMGELAEAAADQGSPP